MQVGPDRKDGTFSPFPQPTSDEHLDFATRHQQKISKILNAKNIDDRTKFLLLAAL